MPSIFGASKVTKEVVRVQEEGVKSLQHSIRKRGSLSPISLHVLFAGFHHDGMMMMVMVYSMVHSSVQMMVMNDDMCHGACICFD